MNYTAQQALQKLQQGNLNYLTAQHNTADISVALRQHTVQHGQRPYAVIVSCADSRVVPEHVFNAGIGELFVIRVAGNVVDNTVLGSIQYATTHLSTPLVVILGHTHCGAVSATIHCHAEHYVKYVTDAISTAIGNEQDEATAVQLNTLYNAQLVHNALGNDATVVSAIYDTASGTVTWL